nr:EOG090X0KPP [Ilyocryptus agilis]
MSKATKKKHVTKEVMDEYVLPEDNKTIVKIVGGRGNNLHEVVTADNETFLVSMPTKFRKNVWIKRGDFVLVQPITEGDKVKAEIVAILYTDQIKYIKSQDKCSSDSSDDENRSSDDENRSSDDENRSSEDDDLFVNTNRPQQQNCASDDSSSEEDSPQLREDADKT